MPVIPAYDAAHTSICVPHAEIYYKSLAHHGTPDMVNMRREKAAAASNAGLDRAKSFGKSRARSKAVME